MIFSKTTRRPSANPVTKRTSPASYPAFLNLAETPALVIGAGPVAERKVAGLLRAGACVTVVAPLASGKIRVWAANGKLRWRVRKFQLTDLRGMRLVFCATDHPDVDEQAARAARRLGLLVNCASASDLGNFILPATAQAGPVHLAVSTGGASPMLARQLVRQLIQLLPAHAGAWSKLLSELRPQILADVPRGQRSLLWSKLTSDRIGALIRDSKTVEARRLARQMIRQATEKSAGAASAKTKR